MEQEYLITTCMLIAYKSLCAEQPEKALIEFKQDALINSAVALTYILTKNLAKNKALPLIKLL